MGLKTGEVSESIQYGITGLCSEQAGSARLLRLMRGHWRIVNGLFHVKDDSFGAEGSPGREDRRVLHSHRSGTVVSLLRATALNLLPAWLLPLVEVLRTSNRSCSVGLCYTPGCPPWHPLTLKRP